MYYLLQTRLYLQSDRGG